MSGVTEEWVTWVQPLAARDRESRTAAAALARTLDERQLAATTGDGEWTVRDEVAHMVGADATFTPVLRAIVTGGQPDLTVFADIDARNELTLEQHRDRPISELAGELEGSGRVLGELFAKLTAEDEARQPEGFPFPLRALVDGYTRHHEYHLGQIRAALAARG